uniref:Alpha-tectorin n=1 Tax=Oncorhynchus tshawytscha TaxID=74940 RepID=A0A8C8LP76_ONCTS
VRGILLISGPLYPFGAGDTMSSRSDDGSSPLIPLSRPFVYFGNAYHQIYVNHNGHLTFNQAWSSNTPYRFPAHSTIDLIAPFWTDLDNRGNGNIFYQQYISGSVLQQATQDINQYFPNLGFSANLVFIATWDRVAYFPNSGTVRLFLWFYIYQNNFTMFSSTSNVNVAGRWAFRTDHGSRGSPVQLGDSFWSDNSCRQRCSCTSTGIQCQSQPCSFSQICQPDAFRFSCQTIERSTCTVSGDPHYYTFDGSVFHFQGTCTYVLSEECGHGLPYYRVEGKNENRGSTQVSWTRLVRVSVYDVEIELVKGHQVNGSFASTPFSLRNGTIQVYQSGFSLAVSTDFGLLVMYDANHYVRISVPFNYFNATCGLCGTFNGHREDDFRSRTGQILTSDVDFANSWQASGDNDPACERVQCAGLDCAFCTPSQRSLYGNTAHCGILQDPSGPFAPCHVQLPPQTYEESCVYDLCVGGGYQPILCQSLNVYATQCQQHGIQPGLWRRQGFCEISCPANSHFESQGTSCPATCSNLNASHGCPLPSQESCICNLGYVLSAGVCVPLAQCGCTFENRYYSSGATVILDQNCGRRCICSRGSMACYSHGCGELEACSVEDGERGCRPTSYATCWVEGPRSYRTFDGVTFQYPGACGLILARVMGWSPHTHFVVSAEKVPRGQQGLTQMLKFEAVGTQVHIEMGGTYNSSLSGLCGNYNGHRHDDFRTPNGVLVNNSQLFGDSWRDGSLSAHCVETENRVLPQIGQNTTVYYSDQSCGLMALPGGPFSLCQSRMGPQDRVEECVEDLTEAGGAPGVLCEALRGYALMCQQSGITVGNWRDVTDCEQTCPPNSHYELCGTSCPASCPSLSFPFLCVTACQEGCQCNDGYLLSANQCVPPVACGCHHQGRYLQGGERFWEGGECQSLCTCNGTTGAVRCTPYACNPQESCRVVEGEYGCHPNPHGTCSASGDPHYLTFDGGAFDFQGTCRYVLATLCGNTTRGLHHFLVEARNEPWNGLTVSITAEVFVNVWALIKTMSNYIFQFVVLLFSETHQLFQKIVEGNYTCSDGCGASCPQCHNPSPARARCEVIKDVEGPLSFCHGQVDPEPYFRDCVFDVCLSGNREQDVLCRAIQTYVSTCQSTNVRIYPWRQNTTCNIECPANSHYELCGSDCGHTCVSSIDASCEQSCTEGCFCDNGYLRSGRHCVPVESCGCQYDGFYYDSFWTQGCSRHCECYASNDLRCSAASCTPNQECAIKNGRLGCFNALSTCTVWGDPHYITFDGAVAHFQGTCSYDIARTCSNHSINGLTFRVVATNRHRGNNLVSFVSLVDVDGSEVSIPSSIGSIAGVVWERGFVMLNSSDLTVQFDGRSTLMVRLGRSHHGAVCGMCGNLNGDPEDDKVLPNGTPARSDNDFGDGWKADTSRCGASDNRGGGDDCPFSVEYTDLCSIITNTTGPFSACHLHSDPQPYFTSCVYDLCLYTPANGMLCSAVAAYEESCSVLGLDIPEWRAVMLCGECPCVFGGILSKWKNWQIVANLPTFQKRDIERFGMRLFGMRQMFLFCLFFSPQSNGTHFIYQNYIQGEVEPHGGVMGVISRAKHLNLRFCCEYPLYQSLSMTMDLKPLESIVTRKLPSGKGHYQMRMIPYQDAGFRYPLSGSHINVEIDQQIYVAVQVDGVDSHQISTVLDSCWATPVNDPNYAVHWNLIAGEYGDIMCPNPEDSTVELIQNGVSTSAHFSFRMFTFTRNSSSVFLHCQVHLCLLHLNNCTTHCYPGHHHRGRRDVSFHDSAAISMGPLVLNGKDRGNIYHCVFLALEYDLLYRRHYGILYQLHKLKITTAFVEYSFLTGEKGILECTLKPDNRTVRKYFWTVGKDIGTPCNHDPICVYTCRLYLL